MKAHIDAGKEKATSLGIRVITSLIIGVICGFLGFAFHMVVDYATTFRTNNLWIIYLLPIAGLVIVLLFKWLKASEYSTSKIFDNAMISKATSILVVPAVFVGTVITHLFGGSTGKEGAAIQMGGGVGSFIGRIFKLDDKHHRVAMLAGMAAFFSALFGTPIAASLFVMMVIFVGGTVYEIYIPVFTASFAAYFISVKLGVEPTRFLIKAPEFELMNLLRVALLGVLCGFVAIAFYKTLHFAHKQFDKIKNPYIRIVIGAVIFLLIVTVIGNSRYLGAGMSVIAEAVELGKVNIPDFVLKIILTAITLGCGFKGGEVVPSFFVGATFGALVGPLLGLNPAFAAAVGLISVFCAATNTIIPSIFMGVELYSGVGIIFITISCIIASFISGKDGLYACQEHMEETDLIKIYKSKK